MKKKIFLVIMAITFLIFAGQRIYWYCRNDCNNLVFILSNQISGQVGEDKAVKIEVYIDNELYYKNDALSELYLFVDDKNVSMGYHTVKVIVDSHFIVKEYFFVFPMKWIVIECWGDGGINDVMLWFSTSPPGLM